MLYGETKITIESLKVWSSALKMEQIDSGKDHPFYDILRAQLLSFQSIIKELRNPGLDPRDELEMPILKSDILKSQNNNIDN